MKRRYNSWRIIPSCFYLIWLISKNEIIAAAASGGVSMIPSPPSNMISPAALRSTSRLAFCSRYSPKCRIPSRFAYHSDCFVFPTGPSLLYSQLNQMFGGIAFSRNRLFGSKAGVPGNPPGTISIFNGQTTLPNIDEKRLEETTRVIQKILGYETYDITIMLVEDDEMQETNLETRNIDRPTDILSFPFHDCVRPGKLKKPDFDIPDYYNLGDIMIDIPYVIRRCQEDQEWAQQQQKNKGSAMDEVDDDGDRGVSGALSTIFDPEERVNMLMVHGMLHLVGYDHEEDDDYELMVTKEEQLLETLFGVKV